MYRKEKTELNGRTNKNEHREKEKEKENRSCPFPLQADDLLAHFTPVCALCDERQLTDKEFYFGFIALKETKQKKKKFILDLESTTNQCFGFFFFNFSLS